MVLLVASGRPWPGGEGGWHYHNKPNDFSEKKVKSSDWRLIH